MAVTVHVDLCTNRSGWDNSTHQSRRHNPFLKDRTNGRQQSGRTAQHRKTKTNNTEQQDTKKHKKTTNKGLEANGEGGRNMQITQKMDTKC